ncbi:enoyl-CoA delta isomerase 2-like isoform X2 [Mercenaria mercenaria]|uniref:enoyl-CoA delta isomerase 2-like isoform X2 n=1 Tax=Mercenaria mercenaria TaxID=6596 RepID=UPI00234EE850|nr:enoyl-CoA delta isomerase 2-like isoform X2 [Mercenaria mercenaria]
MAAPILRKFSRTTAIINNHQRSFHLAIKTMGAYDAEFNKAKERLNSLKEDPGNEAKLKIYALFKQATVGKCNVPKPGMMDIVGKYKWNAWNDLGDISQDEAQKQYIELVDTLAGAETKESSGAQSGTDQKFETLAVSCADGIYSITLNRPSKKNAITVQMYEELILALKEAGADSSVVIATVTGAGDYFCSGNDLGNFMNIPQDRMASMAAKFGDLLQRFVSAFIDFPKPLIGLVNGPAVGVSVTVLGLFDAVYASDRASFHTPFSQLGQSPEGCSSYTFPKLMGAAKASEMLLFNKKISAAEAFNRNLVTQVIPDDVFTKETSAKVQAIAKLPKESMSFSKVLIRDAEREKLHSVNKEECRVLVGRWQSNECMTAIMNFFQQKASSKL